MINLCNLCYNDKYIINDVNINEIDKIFNKYIITYNKKFDFYYINCEVEIQFYNNYSANIQIQNHYNKDYINIKNYLLLYIYNCQFAGYIFHNINHLFINTTFCKTNMTYEIYINTPMSMLDRRINFIIAKNPDLINKLDRTKHHPLIRKYSHIPFNN